MRKDYYGGQGRLFHPILPYVLETMDLKLVSLSVVACVCITLLDQASSSPIAEADGHYGGHGHGHGYGKGYGGHDKYGYGGHDKYGYISMHAEIILITIMLRESSLLASVCGCMAV